MKSRQEFQQKWKNYVAGMALFGTVSEIRDGPLVRATKVMDIPAEVERLLGLMYDDVARDEKIEPSRRNGETLPLTRKAAT